MPWFRNEELLTPHKVVLASCRGLEPVRSRALLYLFEDLVCDLDDAVLLVPRAPAFPSRFQARVAGALFRRGFHHLSRALTPVLPATGTHHELLFIGCQGLGDVLMLLPLFTRKGIAARKTCFIEELWIDDLARSPLAIDCLRQCDFLLVGCAGSVEPLEQLTGRPCHHLPPSVDTLRFQPFPIGDEAPPVKERRIDLYWMGRRQADLHQAFLNWSRHSGRFYLYDTAGNAPTADHLQHRIHLIDLIQRSRYFMVQEAKAGNVARGGQHEIGFRFYEGAAAGTVMLGPTPQTPTLRQAFPHEDAFIAVDGPPSAYMEVMHELDAQPTRREQIGRRNVAHMLRHHDHIHRYLRVLEIAGMEPADTVLRRVEVLAAVANAIS